jgi:predicted AlkP superfamily pyrophosphatase or phosphodiesterase
LDWLIPEYWRVFSSSGALNPLDRELIGALSRPEGLLKQLEPTAGPFMMGDDTSINGDEIKTRYSVEILRKYKPAFMTIHLSALDEIEHEHGPFSAEADQDLETIDKMVERLASAALQNDPSTVIVIVSDHGFVTVTHKVNLFVPFLQAGLIQTKVDPETKSSTIDSWKAEPWLAGGMAAIMMHDPNDHATEQQVRELLAKLAADPNNGIEAVLDRDAIKTTGGFPDAAFLVVLKSGYQTGAATSGNLVTPISGSKGSHGFSPDFPEMRASFFMSGVGIAHHRDLGVIDMRQIAPTVAKILNLNMPSAKAAPLPVEP